MANMFAARRSSNSEKTCKRLTGPIVLYFDGLVNTLRLIVGTSYGKNILSLETGKLLCGFPEARFTNTVSARLAYARREITAWSIKRVRRRGKTHE